DTPLFDGMLVPQQVHDDVVNDVADVDAETTPLSPTPATTPPTQQEFIHSSSQVKFTLPSSPHQSPIAQPSSSPPQQPPSHDAEISMAFLNQLLETCATLTKKETDEAEPAEVEEVHEVVTAAKLMTEVVTTTTTFTTAPIPKASAPRRRREEEESKLSKRKGKNLEQEAAKKQKLDEEVEELKTHLQTVPNDEDDVYIKATPLASKRRLGDVVEDCSRKICIFRAKELLRYGLAKVNSWKLLESCGVHIITFITTQMILLVERRYPLIRFTLEQMFNNVSLEVEEEIKVSLELLRFIRRRQQEGYKPKLQRIYAKGLLLLVKDLLLLVQVKAVG
nr:hypothetical protein [Tanacetum cinerariifolium]